MNLSSVSLAATVASMLAMAACASSSGSGDPAPAPAAKTEASALVKCEGINTCKGTSECQSADGKSGCQGLNECKGQGWISVPKSECDQKGGKVLSGDPKQATADGAAPPKTEKDASIADTKTAYSIKCEGINSCQGTSECAAKDGSSSCKGQNSCAGKGWITVPTEIDCTGKGGKVIS